MTVRGWNPRGQFAGSARDAIGHVRRHAAAEQRHRALAAQEGLSQLSTETPAPMRTMSPDPSIASGSTAR
jgi:hypothetical protein